MFPNSSNLIPDLDVFSTHNGNGKASMFGDLFFMGHRIKNLRGKRFGRFVVLELATERDTWGGIMWLCKCDCGTIFKKSSKYISGTQSCGCLAIETRKTMHFKHGQTETKEYNIWCAMKRRCLTKACKHYMRYGGRGIKVCDRWMHSFPNFIADMGKRPSPNHSIDRIENDGNYEPSNCRWSTKKEQSSNRKNNIWIEFDGAKMILSDWAAHLKIDHRLLWRMLKTKSFEDAYNYYKFHRRKLPKKI